LQRVWRRSSERPNARSAASSIASPNTAGPVDQPADQLEVEAVGLQLARRRPA